MVRSVPSSLTLEVIAALTTAGLSASATFGAARLYVEGTRERACVYRCPGKGTTADLEAARAALRMPTSKGRDRLIVRPSA